MAKRTFKSVMEERQLPGNVGVVDHLRFRLHGEMVLEHRHSLSRPAWTQYNREAHTDQHGRSGVVKNYFVKSKGLWYGWK